MKTRMGVQSPAISVLPTGCGPRHESRDPVERAGEAVDEASEDIGESVDEAGEEIDEHAHH